MFGIGNGVITLNNFDLRRGIHHPLQLKTGLTLIEIDHRNGLFTGDLLGVRQRVEERIKHHATKNGQHDNRVGEECF
ncbi:Uncharacterised protein [Vibrio cholerae]|uniref:Uncharacterized protein n=1 Tax=Vibrio cholerae TaxID=666 RepID=A0A655QRA4_VIBCL|nr:Uncharacterised protein [Vibrio cholerae]